ncbi:hypothetical protein TrVE_jg7809 [Triparma verrucosa]|uniref:Uncharacterized protein n=1 Tax=Triparma verrucosa TaxID=1606542 RepID=A0A9W7ELM5_9STRA|nr:hypothetical protein TrVE_jg7809 [Triparma verrucosa]
MFGSSVKNLKRSIRAAENQKLRGEGVAVKPATVVVAPTSRRAKHETWKHILNVMGVCVGLVMIYMARLEIEEEKELLAGEGGEHSKYQHCDFHVLDVDKIDRKGFQSNFVYKRRPLKIREDVEENEMKQVCSGEVCELPTILPDYLNNFQNFTVNGEILDSLEGAISNGLVRSRTLDGLGGGAGAGGEDLLGDAWREGGVGGGVHKGDVYLRVLKGVFLVDLVDNGGWVNGFCYVQEGEAVFLPNWRNSRGGGGVAEQKNEDEKNAIKGATEGSAAWVLVMNEDGNVQFPNKESLRERKQNNIRL